jgi:hypothetical protein
MNSNTTELLRRLRSAPWLSCLGNPITDAGVLVAKTWEEALADDGSDRWGNTRLQAANALRAKVREANAERFANWNSAADEVRPAAIAVVQDGIVATSIDPKIRPIVADLCKWDIAHALIECEYVDLVRPSFYGNLAAWYLKGHLPCDWIGDYPAGQLVVY